MANQSNMASRYLALEDSLQLITSNAGKLVYDGIGRCTFFPLR